MRTLNTWMDRRWLTVCALALFIGSDFKFRRRDVADTVSGAPDKFIILEIGLYGAVASYLILSRASPPRVRRLPMPMVFLIFYLILVVISLSYAPYFSYAAVRAVEECVVVGLCLTAGLQATRGDFHQLAHGFVALVAGCAVYGVVIKSEPYSPLQVGRFSFLAVHPNVSGIYFGAAAVIAMLYLINRRQTQRPGPHWHWGVYTSLFAVVSGALIATETRAAVLGAVLGILLGLLTSVRGRKRIEIIGALLLGTATVYLTVLPTIESYLARGESAQQLGTLNSRTTLWSEAWTAILQAPIWGHGLGAARGIFLDTIGLGGAHNAVINVAVDLGGMGLLVWGTLVISLTLAVLRLRPHRPAAIAVDRSLMLALVGFFLLDGMFVQGPGDVTNIASTWLYLLVGWSAMLARPGIDAAAVSALPAPWGRPDLEPVRERPPAPNSPLQISAAPATVPIAVPLTTRVSAAPPTVPIALPSARRSKSPTDPQPDSV